MAGSMDRTYYGHVKFEQVGVAEEAVVQSRHVAPYNERHDTRVVELITPASNHFAVIQDGVKGGAHAETDDISTKVAGKGEDVGSVGGAVPRADNGVYVCGADDGSDGAEQMRPDVDKLIVDVEERAPAVGVGAADLAVARVDEAVVAAPGGQVIPEEEQRVLDLVLDGLGGVDDGGAERGPALAHRGGLRLGLRRGGHGGVWAL